MPLNRVERIEALSLFAKQEYSALGRLIEESRNLNLAQKVDALGSLVQLLEVGRIQYDAATKQVIDDILEVIGQEEGDTKVRPIAANE